MDRYYMLYQILQLQQTQEERNSLAVMAPIETPSVNQEAHSVKNELPSANTKLQSGKSDLSTFSIYPGLAPVAEGVVPWHYPVPSAPMSYPVVYEVVPMAGFRHGL